MPKVVVYHLIILLLVGLLEACATTPQRQWQAQTGLAVNAEDKSPIANVFVVAIWKGDTEYEGVAKSVCYHLLVVKTDGQGQFFLPAWQEPEKVSELSRKSVKIAVYKPNYWADTITQYALNNQSNIFELKLLINGSKHIQPQNRLKYLMDTVAATSCNLSKKNLVQLNELYQLLLKEATQVAKSESDRAQVNTIKQWTEALTN